MEENKKTQLSKAVLDMKFMKKTKERVEKEADDAEGQAMYSQHITEEMKKSGQVLFVDASIMQCKDLVEGRLSFGRMNPDIERIMADTYMKRTTETKKKQDVEVTDVEMAKGYSTLVDTMGKKFHGKGRHKNTNKKFLKPQPL